MNQSKLLAFAFLGFLLGQATIADAIFIDGEGHYGLQPEMQTNPGANRGRGVHQATLQSFRLLGQVRSKDTLSLNLEFRLFQKPREAYLGDTVEPEDCSNLVDDGEEQPEGKRPHKENNPNGSAKDCTGRHQNSGEPGYQPYQPTVNKVWVEYAFKYCLLEVGRRGRDWGMGIFLDSGNDPFETSASIFDGASCSLNLQKTQVLGFSFGMDRLAETGTNVDVGVPKIEDSNHYGASKGSDDLDQFFFTVEYNDRKANAGAPFTRQVGIYFANVFAKERLDNEDKSQAGTDIKFADLYTGFYFLNFSFENELLFRLGKSADPSWSRYGGIASETDTGVVRNDVTANGIAGRLAYTFERSGVVVGPAEFNQGTAASHDIFLEYAFAPGDRGGYYSEYTTNSKERVTNDSQGTRDRKADAMAFNRNYKPALILFNGHSDIDDLRIDGVFDPNRVMNAMVLSAGYDYKSLVYGNFQSKLIYAQLSKSAPKDIKPAQEHKEACSEGKATKNCGSLTEASDTPDRPIGYSGKDLGWELDLKYSKSIDKDLDLGVAGGVLLPGAAWRTNKDSPPAMGYMLQGNVVFKF